MRPVLNHVLALILSLTLSFCGAAQPAYADTPTSYPFKEFERVEKPRIVSCGPDALKRCLKSVEDGRRLAEMRRQYVLLFEFAPLMWEQRVRWQIAAEELDKAYQYQVKASNSLLKAYAHLEKENDALQEQVQFANKWSVFNDGWWVITITAAVAVSLGVYVGYQVN